MPRTRATWSAAAVTVASLMLAASAVAQYPVYDDGHALDANPALGQFGRNMPRQESYLSPPNLVITGNITGGRYFRGVSPIRDFSSFSVDLPSANLSGFLRDGVGIDQVIGSRGGVVAPRPFFAIEQTVPDAGAILSGLTIPGGNLLRGTDVNPNVGFQDLGVTPGSTLYQPLQDTRILNTGNTLRPEVLPGAAAPALARPQGFVNPALLRSPLIATNPNLSDRAAAGAETPLTEPGLNPDVAADLLPAFTEPAVGATASGGSSTLGQAGPGWEDYTQALPAPGSEVTSSWGGQQQPLAVPIDGRVDGRAQAGFGPVDDRVDLRRGGQGVPGTTGSSAPAPEDRLGLSTVPPPTSTAGRPGLQQEGTFPVGRRPGDDVFADMTRAVASLQTPPPGAGAPETGLLIQPTVDSPEAWARPLAPEAAAETAAEGEPAFPGAAAASASPRPAEGEEGVVAQGAVVKPTPEMAELTEARGPVPADMLNRRITTFAGAEDTRLNHYLRRAESFLRNEDYFRAARQYELAALLDPDNPLVWLGRGHALVAAGDYVQAVRSLIKGIERFPEIAYFQLSLHDFIPDASLLESRRADLETRLAGSENAELRFLLGYVEYYTGLQSYGLEDLQRASALAPKDTTIARFAEILKAGRGSSDESNATEP